MIRFIRNLWSEYLAHRCHNGKHNWETTQVLNGATMAPTPIHVHKCRNCGATFVLGGH